MPRENRFLSHFRPQGREFWIVKREKTLPRPLHKGGEYDVLQIWTLSRLLLLPSLVEGVGEGPSVVVGSYLF